MKDIKEYRNNELNKYIIANILIILLFSNILSFSDSFQINIGVVSSLISSAVMSAVLFIFPFVIDNMLGDKLKDKMIYLWRKRPGATIFSDIQNKKVVDDRFTIDQIKEKYSSVFEKMPPDKNERYRYENSSWYSIYHPIRNADKIYYSHKDYLLCRDMNIVTYIILLFYILIVCFNTVISLNWICIVYEVLMIVGTNIAARNKAKRFVCNVIAFDLNDKGKKETSFMI